MEMTEGNTLAHCSNHEFWSCWKNIVAIICDLINHTKKHAQLIHALCAQIITVLRYFSNRFDLFTNIWGEIWWNIIKGEVHGMGLQKLWGCTWLFCFHWHAHLWLVTSETTATMGRQWHRIEFVCHLSNSHPFRLWDEFDGKVKKEGCHPNKHKERIWLCKLKQMRECKCDKPVCCPVDKKCPCWSWDKWEVRACRRVHTV